MDYIKFRLRSFTTLESKYILQCGSYYELPIKYTIRNLTDTDCIECYYDICVIPWNRRPPINTRCTVLRIDSKQTPPGFAKLKIDRDNKEDNPNYFRRPPLLREIKSGGPSWPYEQSLEHEEQAFLNIYQNAISFDIVPAVYSPYWPHEAEEWRVRKGFHGWPNEKLIARITRGGCHFVSKLRTWSSSDDTEWRFSFSKAELLLIHSWTPDQIYAYHAIRLIKRKISEACGGDRSKVLQTYYFKTLMLWACEEFPPEFWPKQNANTYLEILFCRFLRCLDEKFCPNYFIPECNVMSHLTNEGSFDKDVQVVQKYVTMKLNIVDAKCSTFQDEFANPSEYLCLAQKCYIFPLYENLNGRCAQYLSECEWFLPKLQNLHTAIEAHLHLMSVDSVTERQTSKDYVVCVENFNCALLSSSVSELYVRVYGDETYPKNWIRIFIRKLFRNSVLVYSRMSHEDYAFRKMIKESFPSLLESVTSAYCANFYLTAIKFYKKALIECEKCFKVLHNKAHVDFFITARLSLVHIYRF